LRSKVEIVGAGRTDTGVHAKQMYAHFDFESLIPENLVQKMNAFLPHDIVIYDFILVDNASHARFDAIERTYEYHIHPIKNPFLKEASYHFMQTLNMDDMNKAAQILLTYNDFECFSKLHTDVNTFICKITEAHWQKNNNQLIFTITANRFLRNMVRAIVGTLLDVGVGKINVNDLHQIIQSKNRNQAGFSVPAHGLYLTNVKYPYI
jgi:tRNA pseudouridine38-40 synthase